MALTWLGAYFSLTVVAVSVAMPFPGLFHVVVNDFGLTRFDSDDVRRRSNVPARLHHNYWDGRHWRRSLDNDDLRRMPYGFGLHNNDLRLWLKHSGLYNHHWPHFELGSHDYHWRGSWPRPVNNNHGWWQWRRRSIDDGPMVAGNDNAARAHD